MDVCDPRHNPKYQVTYNSAKGSNQNHMWAVCDECMKDKLCFYDKNQIISIDVLT